jgi:hypothetical protein
MREQSERLVAPVETGTVLSDRSGVQEVPDEDRSVTWVQSVVDTRTDALPDPSDWDTCDSRR